MQRYRYLRDPIFLTGCCAYAINRWLVKPHIHSGFFHSHFNDCWLIPCALPPILWLHRRLGLRAHDRPPQVSEITLHLLFWSFLFEWIGPRFVSHTTGDPMDLAAYFAGAVVAGLWWAFHLKPATPVHSEKAHTPLPRLHLTGIITILKGQRALLKAEFPAKPPERGREESYILTEGQRAGPIEVLEINEKKEEVKVDNSGTITNLTFEKIAPPHTTPVPFVSGRRALPYRQVNH